MSEEYRETVYQQTHRGLATVHTLDGAPCPAPFPMFNHQFHYELFQDQLVSVAWETYAGSYYCAVLVERTDVPPAAQHVHLEQHLNACAPCPYSQQAILDAMNAESSARLEALYGQQVPARAYGHGMNHCTRCGVPLVQVLCRNCAEDEA